MASLSHTAGQGHVPRSAQVQMLAFFFVCFLLFSHFLSDWGHISHVSAAPGRGLLEFLLSPMVLSGDVDSPGLVASPRPHVLSPGGRPAESTPRLPATPEKTWVLPQDRRPSLKRPPGHPSVPVYQRPLEGLLGAQGFLPA